MARKVEKWSTEIFPGNMRITREYKHLTNRELAIVAVGSLDLALAEAITGRLRDDAAQCADFLGLGDRGDRSPAGTFSARIQLAYLLRIIDAIDADVLNLLRKIRNEFSHKVKVDFDSPRVAGLLDELTIKFFEGTPGGAAGNPRYPRGIFLKRKSAGADLVRSVFAI